MRNGILYLLFSLLLLPGCKKDKVQITNEEPKTMSWTLDSLQFNISSVLLTSSTVNDSILAVAGHAGFWHVNINQLDKSPAGRYFNITGNYDQYTQPVITSQMGVVLLDSHHIKIFSVLPPLSDNGDFIYTPTYSNGIYSHKTFPVVYPSGAGYPIINSKYMLTPDELDYETQKAYVNLLQLNQSPANTQPHTVNLVAAKPIVLTPADATLGFADGSYFSDAFFGKFFLYYADQFYRVDTFGNVKKFGYSPVLGVGNGRVMQMFKLNNYLFTVGLGNWFVSQDEGETWSFYLDALGTMYPGLKYINIGDELYATHLSQVWKVTLIGDDLNFQELDNTGLPDQTQITSLSKVGKYVFATTLTGLYYRDTAGFNTFKK